MSRDHPILYRRIVIDPGGGVDPVWIRIHPRTYVEAVELAEEVAGPGKPTGASGDTLHFECRF